MKDYKLILISFVLLIFMIGAVSAADFNETVIGEDTFTDDTPISVGEDTSNIKDIYVKDTGDDSNNGSSDSPYATIGRAIEDVNESDQTIIHIGEGTYSSDNDLGFNIINLHHQSNGNANLKFIGAGADKTIIDGQASFQFAHFFGGTNVTLKDIAFINCNGGELGGTVYSEGILNVENCIFKDSYCTSCGGGAIAAGWEWGMEWSDGWVTNLTVKNSQFISCSVNSIDGWMESNGGGAIYAGHIKSYIENNTFINTKVSEEWGSGAAILLWYGESKLINNKFINITGFTDDASISYSYSGSITELINNEFINCTIDSDMYSIVNLGFSQATLKNNTFINSVNSVGNYYSMTNFINKLYFTSDSDKIYIGDDEINNGFSMPIKVTDDNGNIIKSDGDYKVVISNENNSYQLDCNLNDGFLNVVVNNVPDNGIYNLTVLYWSMGGLKFLSSSDVVSTVIVNLTNGPVELYVSPEGSDANNGTVDSPFATIQHALDVGFEKSFTVVVHLLEGTYSGDGNVELNIANKGNVKLIGEKYNETIIDGNNTNWFISVGITNVYAENLKFINGKGTNKNVIYGNFKLFLQDCIVDSNAANYVMRDILFDNLVYTNNNGSIRLNSYYDDIIVSNTYFANNNGPVLNLKVYNNQLALVENCTFINNTAKNSGAAITASNGLISRNNYYEGNTAPSSAVFDVSAEYINTFENDTFVNNKATEGTGGVIGFGESPYNTPTNYFNNCKFINNSAVKGGAISLTNGNITNSVFINNTADYGGAILMVPVAAQNEYELTDINVNFVDVTFDGNVANINGHDIYFNEKENSIYVYDYKFLDLNIVFNDLNVSSLIDTLTVNVTTKSNVIIGGGFIDFELDGKKIGTGEIVNGVASFEYAGFEDGVYALSGKTEYAANHTIYTNATVTVKLEGILDNITFWVSNDGSDENGTGSENNPFKSISHAVSVAIKNSRNIIINIAEGNYSGDLNTALELSSMNNLTLIGSGINKTIIDGENSTYFAKVTEGKNIISISDLTIKNMQPDNRQTLTTDVTSPITVVEGGSLVLDNVEIVDNHGGVAIIENGGNLTINNSVFIRNGITRFGVISGIANNRGSSNGGNVIIDNSLFEDNYALKSFFAADDFLINNSEIKNLYIIGDRWNPYFDLISYDSYSKQSATILNTIISHDGSVEDLNDLGVNTNGKYINPALNINGNLYMENSSMVNNFNGTLNSLTQVASIYDLSVLGYAYGASKNVSVYNSSFINFNYIWMSNSGVYNFTFDGCSFVNLTKFAFIRNADENSIYNLTNSVFLNCTPLINLQHYMDQPLPTTFNFNDNYWGNNTPSTFYFMKNSGLRDDTYTPDTWIVLFSEDNQTLIKNVTDGENITAYTGNAPIKVDYADNEGTLDYAVVFDDIGYYLTTDNETNVVLNPENELYPFEAADPMDYRTPSVITITGLSGDLNIVGVLVDPVGNPIANATISSIIDGVNVANVTTDANGTFTVKGIKNGVLTILFNGTVDYFDTEYNLTFADAGKTTKSFINLDVIESDLAVKGRLVDDEGNPIANATITYTINGENATNVTTDADGVFQVQAASDAVVDIVFAGSEGADPVNTTLTIKGLATLRSATVIEGNNFTQNAIEYGAGERGGNFTVQLKDANGNVLANKTVLIGYNGKVLERVTNATGHASVQINLKDENRLTFAVAFLGDEDYNATMSVYLITIAKKPVTMTAAAKSFKAAAKSKKYSVTLKTVKGASADGKTYFAAGKVVKLSVNGKTYTAKTNAKGQATFNLKLTKKGKFTAKVSYAGDKTYNAVSKSVKLTIN